MPQDFGPKNRPYGGSKINLNGRGKARAFLTRRLYERYKKLHGSGQYF